MAHLGTEVLPGQTALSSRHRCEACQTEFTATPAQVGDIRCKLKSCRSYDVDADVDLRISKGPVVIHGPRGPVRIPQKPLDPARSDFLQERKSALVVVRRAAAAPSPAAAN